MAVGLPAGDTGADVGKAVCKDPSGNIYLTGEFKDAAPAGGVMFGGFNLTGSAPGLQQAML